MKTKALLFFASLLLFVSCNKEQQQQPQTELIASINPGPGFYEYSVIYNPNVQDSAYVVFINDSGNYAIMDTVGIENKDFKTYLDKIDSIYSTPNFQWLIQIDRNGFTQMRKTDLNAVPQ